MPNKNLTRGELAVVAARIAGLPVRDPIAGEHFAVVFYESLEENGLMTQMRFDEDVTRGDMAIVFQKSAQFIQE